MGRKRIVLINVYYPESGYGDKLNYPPLGVGYFSEYLDEKGVDHDVIDMGLGYSSEDVLSKISSLKPGFVGVSINSLFLDKTDSLIRKIKSAFPDAKVVVGGPHVTT
ncbi:cobalamin B12-binding domain-containing protein, partial [Candidatus Woesearchaeota archaeon]|nr:cobalamin B12-binding domain-containing protein [Candidatus Woesearchaeota archaeon]